MKDVDWVVVGRFGRAHGLKGFISIQSFTNPRENILSYADWHVYLNKAWQPLDVLHVEVNNKLILAQIEGYREREQLANLTNHEIAVNRTELPALEEDEYYWHELIGMEVINQQGIVLGKVTEILPTGANDVLVVSGEKRYLIPYLPGQFISKIDSSQKAIIVEWDADF